MGKEKRKGKREREKKVYHVLFWDLKNLVFWGVGFCYVLGYISVFMPDFQLSSSRHEV